MRRRPGRWQCCHVLAYFECGDRNRFSAAIEKATDDFLGWFHFRPEPTADPDMSDTGYRLNRAAWGKGYAAEGSRALVHKGFTELGAIRVIAYAFAANTASRRVMEKAGLTFVCQVQYSSNEISDQEAVEYALEKADWERQQTA